MRILLPFFIVAMGFLVSAARADEAFVKVMVNRHVGYIIPEKAALKLNRPPSSFLPDAVGFWTPGLKDVAQAEYEAQQAIWRATVSPERVYPRWVRQADGGLGVPTLRFLKGRAMEIDQRYDSYTRQFIGLVLRNGRKKIYGSYFLNPRVTETVEGKLVAHDEYEPSRKFVPPKDNGVDSWQVIYEVDGWRFDGLIINSSP